MGMRLQSHNLVFQGTKKAPHCGAFYWVNQQSLHLFALSATH